MIIGIDIDDTITDTYEVMFNYAQDYTINILKKEPIIREVNQCNTHSYIEALYNWTTEESRMFWKMYYEKNLREVKPKTLALEFLQKLKNEGNQIILITARIQPKNYYLDVQNETEKWLKLYNIPYDKLIINGRQKEIIAQEENIDVFIDDSFYNCQAVSNVGIKTYIMDTRVNRGLDTENIERVYSWPHVYMKLKNK